MTGSSETGSAHGPPALAVEHPDLVRDVHAVGLRVTDEADPAAVAFVATSVAGARRAADRALPFLLRVTGERERSYMESSDLVECSFVDGAGLRDRLAWLEDRGWRVPERRPDRLDLVDAVSQQRAWLANLREAEVEARIAHAEAAAQAARHTAALASDRSALAERIAEMESTPAWRVHMALAKIKRRAFRIARTRGS